MINKIKSADLRRNGSGLFPGTVSELACSALQKLQEASKLSVLPH
jgi:hypothetical protein